MLKVFLLSLLFLFSFLFKYLLWYWRVAFVAQVVPRGVNCVPNNQVLQQHPSHPGCMLTQAGYRRCRRRFRRCGMWERARVCGPCRLCVRNVWDCQVYCHPKHRVSHVKRRKQPFQIASVSYKQLYTLGKRQSFLTLRRHCGLRVCVCVCVRVCVCVCVCGGWPRT